MPRISKSKSMLSKRNLTGKRCRDEAGTRGWQARLKKIEQLVIKTESEPGKGLE